MLCDVHAPLSAFPWQGGSSRVFPGLLLHRNRPQLGDLVTNLSEFDREDVLQSTRYWLSFEHQDGAEPSAGATVTLFLLALWLVRPTRTHVRFRFQVRREAGNGETGSFHRMLDQFNWIPGHVRSDLGDADLRRAATYYRGLWGVLLAKGRLRDALVLNAAGCMAHRWQVGFICHSAAAEAILTYSKAGGVTERLAKSYACLTRRSVRQRDLAYRRFRCLYGIRSDIMHGRLHRLQRLKKLRTLAQVENVMRALWRQVLWSGRVRCALEGTDTDRRQFMLSMQEGYESPAPS